MTAEEREPFPEEGTPDEWRLVRGKYGFTIYDTVTECMTLIEDNQTAFETEQLMRKHGVREVDSVDEFGSGPLMEMRFKLKAEGKTENEIRAALKEYLRQHGRRC